MALAKQEPFVAVNDPVNEQGELWFAFGEDPEDALARLKSELIWSGVGRAEPVA